MQRFAANIYYVRDVKKSAMFFVEAFGWGAAGMDPEGHFAELDTGGTRLGFVSFELADKMLGTAYYKTDAGATPMGAQIDVNCISMPYTFACAVQAGAQVLVEPKKMPWDQIIAYVRDPNGLVIKLASEADLTEEEKQI